MFYEGTSYSLSSDISHYMRSVSGPKIAIKTILCIRLVLRRNAWRIDNFIRLLLGQRKLYVGAVDRESSGIRSRTGL